MKKAIKIFLAALVITSTSLINVKAAMPPGSVVIGEKAFDLNYLMNPTAEDNDYILKFVITGKEIYVKNFAGQWVKNSDNSSLSSPKDIIPEVVYKDINGEETTYNKGDGEVIKAEEFYVVDIY